MRDGIVYFIKFILSVAILIFAEQYYFWFLNTIGINTNHFNALTTSIAYLIMYAIIFSIIYFFFKEDLRSGFNRFRHKAPSNILSCLVAFIIMLLVVIITNYICKAIGNSLDLNYKGIYYLNIFNKTLNLSLIITIIQNVILIPFIYVAVFVLSINDTFNSRFGIVLSGLLYALFEAYLIRNMGTSNIIINVIPRFVIFTILGYIYQKYNNIAFSIVTYILFILLSGLIVTKFL